MSLYKNITKISVASVVAIALMTSGCTKKPSQEELGALDNARGAAIGAEQLKKDKIEERMALEEKLATQKAVLAPHEDERDELKKKMEERGE